VFETRPWRLYAEFKLRSVAARPGWTNCVNMKRAYNLLLAVELIVPRRGVVPGNASIGARCSRNCPSSLRRPTFARSAEWRERSPARSSPRSPAGLRRSWLGEGQGGVRAGWIIEHPLTRRMAAVASMAPGTLLCESGRTPASASIRRWAHYQAKDLMLEVQNLECRSRTPSASGLRSSAVMTCFELAGQQQLPRQLLLLPNVLCG